MRRKWLLGVGLAALVGGSAAGQQFGIERPVSPTAPAPPTMPVSPTRTPSGPSAIQPAVPVSPVSPAVPVSPAPPPRPTSPRSDYQPLYGSPSSPSPASNAYVPPTDGVGPASYNTVPSRTANIQPVASFSAVQVNSEIPTALPKDHPWFLKQEHGPWFILVKSYVRPSKDSRAAQEQSDKGLSALELAEGLASEIRDTFKVQAFLFEYISEERRAEHRAIMESRQKAANEYVAKLRELEYKAQLQGTNFLMPDNKFRARKYETRDQIGVLVGGFQSEADAVKALAILKKWPAPKNEMLMDGGAIVSTTQGSDGKTSSSTIERTRLNPYPTAFVVHNPASVLVNQGNNNRPQRLDPFLVKLNEGQPYNLLKSPKTWTLAVKSFSSPVEIVNKDADTSLMRKFGFNKNADVLAASAGQAETLAKAIRSMTDKAGKPLNLEAFVLHTRTASLVTVGQFDGPDDPELHMTQRLLASMTLRVGDKNAPPGVPGTQAMLFDKLLPMPIPK